MKPRSKVTIHADFPGATVAEALEGAEKELDSLPLDVDWHEIQIANLFEPPFYGNADDNARDVMREKEWTWVATLKAKGLSRS